MKRKIDTNTSPTTKKMKPTSIIISGTNEMWIHILSFLDPVRELLPNILFINKFFYQILGGDMTGLSPNTSVPGSSWRGLIYERVSIGCKSNAPMSHIVLKKYDSNKLMKLFEMIQRVTPQNGLKHLDMGIKGEMGESIEIELSLELFQFLVNTQLCSSVKKLRFSNNLCVFYSNLQDGEREVVKKWFASLKELEYLPLPILVRDSTNFPMDDLLRIVFKECKLLKKISIGYIDQTFQDDSIVCNNLTELDMTDTEGLEMNDNFFKMFPKLKKLKLGYSMGYSNNMFTSIVENCKEIEELTYGERYLNETANIPIIYTMPKLKKLIITEGHPYEDELEQLAQHATNLTYFDLGTVDEYEGYEYPFSKFLKDIGSRLTNVQYNYLVNDNNEIDEGDDEKEEEHEIQEEEVDERDAIITKINKDFPNCEIIEFIHSDDLQCTIADLFNEITHLKYITVNVSADLSNAFNSAAENSLLRNEAANKLSKMIHGNEQSCELRDDTHFYTSVNGCRLYCKITNMEEGVQFKVVKI